jgi:ABC-2 type transport system permease protein
MKNETLFAPDKEAARGHSAVYWAVADMLVIAQREYRRVGRNSDEMLSATLVPVMFFLIFRFVFGGAITIPGTNYTNYLVAGLLTMSVAFGSASTALGLVGDLQSGLLDRFLSLPMARSAILTGRTFSVLVRNLFIILIVWAISFLLGFRPEGSLLSCLAAIGLLLLGCLTFSWFFSFLALWVRSLELFASIGPLCVLLFVFFSSGLAPTNTMPYLLRVYVEHQPVSLLINAVRGLVLNQTDPTAIWQTVVWNAVLLAIFIPLSLWLYDRRTAR